MTDKSTLKVYDVPFTTTITGTIKALASSPEEATLYLNRKIEDGSLGLDKFNLTEEGVLHDGSISFGPDIEVSEMEIPQGKSITESSDDPASHPDWFAFDDEEELEASTDKQEAKD